MRGQLNCVYSQSFSASFEVTGINSSAWHTKWKCKCYFSLNEGSRKIHCYSLLPNKLISCYMLHLGKQSFIVYILRNICSLQQFAWQRLKDKFESCPFFAVLFEPLGKEQYFNCRLSWMCLIHLASLLICSTTMPRFRFAKSRLKTQEKSLNFIL